jgi:Uri superfamily endonuclease
MTKGVCVLIITVSKDASVNIGALGKMLFEKGLYVYVGSAQNNLEKRTERHFGKSKRKFWHCDYLLGNDDVKVWKVFYRMAKKPEECWIAKELSKKGVPTKGLGSSDCNRESHLIELQDYAFLRESMHELTI